MAHQRKLIRDAVVARLKADLLTLSSRVYGNRSKPIFKSELPLILVYTDEEPAEISAEAPREYLRKLKLSLEIVDTSVANATDSVLDDQLDALAALVEESIFGDETFGGLVTDTILVNTEATLIEEGEKPVGALKITLEMPYFQRLPGDTFADDLDAFETANTTYTVGGADTAKPVDSQELPQPPEEP